MTHNNKHKYTYTDICTSNVTTLEKNVMALFFWQHSYQRVHTSSFAVKNHSLYIQYVREKFLTLMVNMQTSLLYVKFPRCDQ